MSTNKRIEVLCVACATVALLVCAAMYVLRGVTGADKVTSHAMGYEQTLFDTSKVHTIDIVMDDWDSFIAGCESEEYALCTVVIDGESFKNVAIRAKGNTSLSSVSQLGSQRYSFKVEFDQYENGKTYHGLDKLSLNNIIQDNTYMKDYLTYTMMGAFGVDSPLASYAYITVNGEDWGLYLAVEGVEDSFLERTHGTESGELYKPDSMSFGGGRGNGREFDMDEFLAEQESEEESGQKSQQESGQQSGQPGQQSQQESSQQSQQQSEQQSQQSATQSESAQDSRPTPPSGGFGGGMGGFGGMGSSDVKLQYIDDDPSSYTSIFNNAKTDVSTADKKRLIESLRKLSAGEDLEDVLDMDQVLRYFVVHDYVCNGDSYTGSMIHNYYLYESDGKLSMIPWDYNLAFGGFAGGDATAQVNAPIDDPTASGFGFGGGGFSRGGDGADQASQESDAASTTDSDGASNGFQMPGGGEMPQMPGNGEMPQMPGNGEMPQMPEGMEMPSDGSMPQMPGASQSDGDSQASEGSGAPSMPDGQGMSFPGFGGSSDSDSRPMVDWIFSDEQYTQAYHELYQQFLDEVDVQAIIDETAELIAPYVESDPTKFCTYEEFQTGVDTLRSFCQLRSQSVQGQLNGTIPSTEEGQQEDSSALVDASAITISDMGSMGNGGGGGRPGGGGQQPGAQPGNSNDSSTSQPNGMPGGDGSNTSQQEAPQAPSENAQGSSGEGSDQQKPEGGFDFSQGKPTGGDFTPPGDMPSGAGGFGAAATNPVTSLITIGASVVAVLCAIGVTFLFRRP